MLRPLKKHCTLLVCLIISLRDISRFDQERDVALPTFSDDLGPSKAQKSLAQQNSRDSHH